jgi:hypothetical protein
MRSAPVALTKELAWQIVPLRTHCLVRLPAMAWSQDALFEESDHLNRTVIKTHHRHAGPRRALGYQDLVAL